MSICRHIEKRFRGQVLLEACGGMWMVERGGDSNSLKADMSWTEVDMGDETDNTKKPKPLLWNQWIE